MFVEWNAEQKRWVRSANAKGDPDGLYDKKNPVTAHELDQHIEIINNRFVVSKPFMDEEGVMLGELVNDIGGVNVLVDPAMRDVYSGAMFQRGWFAMNGDAALAFARNRKTVANGDFTRSANQGKFLLSTMAKLREEVSTVPGLVSWIASFKRNAATNLAPSQVLMLAQIARNIDPANIQNVVLSGKSAKVGGQDIVNLTPTYSGLFTDIGRDAVNDGK